MPYPAQRPHPLAVAMRFFCGRRGAATARALITLWTFAGLALGGFASWAAREAWSEFKAMRAGIAQINAYIAGDDARWQALRDDLNEVKADARDLTERVNGIDVRLAREEGARLRDRH